MARPISPLTKLILSFPREDPVAEVVGAVAARGLTTSAGNVHHVRAMYEIGADGSVRKRVTEPAPRTARAARAASRGGGSPVGRAPHGDRHPSGATAQPSAVETRDAGYTEDALKAAVVEVVLEFGVDRATTVFDEVVAAIRSVELA